MGNTLRKLALHEGVPADTLSGSYLITTLTDRVHCFVFSYSIEHRTLLAWSGNAEEILGVRDLAIAKDGNLFLRHVHADDRYLLMTDLERALKGEGPYRATYRWLRPDNNELRWIHCRAGVIKREGKPIFEGLLFDLSEEFTGEIGQLAGPDSLNTILSAFPTLVFTVDRDLRLKRVNRKREDEPFRFGDPNFHLDQFRIGRPLLEAFADKELRDFYAKLLQYLLDGRTPHYRSRIKVDEIVYNLEIIPLINRAVIDGLLFNVSDISESVKLERQLAQLQKMEGLGLLAEGVAHNFNNALQGILGHAAIVSNHPENRELVKKAGEEIMDIVTRSSELTRQLMLLGEKNTSQLGSVDLNLVAMAALNELQDLYEEGVRVTVSFGNVPKVRGERLELQKVIEAIVKNAYESIVKKSAQGGNISVRSGQVVLKDEGPKPGVYALLAVSDNGTGMGYETKERCIEPFFTVKERDQRSGVGIKSSGLGLSAAYTVATRLGGTLKIESRVGMGTKVSLYLPAEEKIEERIQREDKKPSTPPQILVVDDDRMVLQTVESIIKDLGFSCVTAEDPHRTLELLKSHHRSLKVILMDLIMPGMDGVTLLKKVRKINKNIKVIGFSGASTEQLRPMVEAGAVMVLRKPVGPKELQSALKAYLA